ncbi:MAG TPA: 4-(cytidine 5'-diphospho)-2-C-methyl-D-erythritol kinase [Candidatus Binatia bacterium]|nr:4-(cytidine 5'-diphospho)-2-C-methyl-D-erythritol kinase [Candidatus Binatia bacterium]
MTPAAWPAPAKLNLFLHITGRRADGYHELQTAFQFLDHGDEVFIEPTRDGRIRRAHDLPGVSEDADLTLRAARLLAGRAGGNAGCVIRVDKRLPMGAGLGGGSSDAATVLSVLNREWKLLLADDELARLGLMLGADVPVFIRGHAAWAEGVGELLTPIEPPECWYLVITPPCAVDTREMYASSTLRRDLPRIPPDDWRSGRARTTNVFEPLVRKRFPSVAQALDRLGRLAPHPRLSGSGSSVFADFPDRDSADRAARRLADCGATFVARGCNVSPLKRRLDHL